MSPLKLSLLSSFVAVSSVSVWCGWIQRSRAAEVQSLRATLAARSAAAPVTSLPPSQPKSTSSATPKTPVAQTIPTSPSADAGDYRFQGQATPIDALQTLAWALDRGDVALLMNLITFDAAARTKWDAYWSALPPEARAKWASADTLAATLLADRGIHQPYPRADLLSRGTIEPLTADRVRVRLPGTPKDGEVYQKIGDTWKWVVTEALVDAYLQRTSPPNGQRQ